MIKFNLKAEIEPYKIFLANYKLAEAASQTNIEAACLSTCTDTKIPRSRFVNIKYINDDEIIFFSNYQSPKARDIAANNHVALNFLWNAINVQVRIQGIAHKLDENRSDNHWKLRKYEKNILAISSNQSSQISSYTKIKDKYKEFAKDNLLDRPSYWGGYVIVPSYFEIWEGHESRINKRLAFKLSGNAWESFYLEP
jgi:pyridoxamine 5'-phosphate oxidase